MINGMFRRNEGNLEGRLILLAGDSNNSRDFRNDIAKHLRGDHQFSNSVVRVDSQIIDYSNGEVNFRLYCPDDNLTMDKLELMIRAGDTHIISKLENPELKDPLRYHLDQFVRGMSKKYVQLSTTAGLEVDKVRERFFNYMAINIGKEFRNVIKEDVLE